MHLGSRKNKNDMRWRFLKRLQQGIKCRLRQHMDFINDINLKLGTLGLVGHRFL